MIVLLTATVLFTLFVVYAIRKQQEDQKKQLKKVAIRRQRPAKSRRHELYR